MAFRKNGFKKLNENVATEIELSCENRAKGYCNSSFQPHNRGFDTWYGHYAGSMSYFTHTLGSMYTRYLNHYVNDEPFLNETYMYATYDFGANARSKLIGNLVKIIFENFRRQIFDDFVDDFFLNKTILIFGFSTENFFRLSRFSTK